ncbi:CocE/NonD family hydrolase [Sclerotinia borealis F-4128]|uniref:CocE/NonD family hydrolase n=1 Tax=Sclerotinia borealis (strain F-4128) TaxID=1432307 RepID=W9C928_SCLBF|nr:CocE/NonD family hydrolase [Sclerotinia borealis F-4128]
MSALPNRMPLSSPRASTAADIFHIGNVSASFTSATSSHLAEANPTPFNQTSKVLAKGSYPVSKLYPPLPCDILFESDVAVELRDGTFIYTDIYRPANTTNLTSPIPAIVAYSPYGKRGGFFNYDIFQPPNAIERMDVKYEWVSGLEKFEGPNPAYWLNKGYAVIHPDPRGVFNSEGDILMFGQQDARDGYDLIEWVAARSWSNGKVGMTGNSWLTVAQWWIASERPPHLAAIAPWEGWSDFYEDLVFRGGIPNFPFVDVLVTHLYGNGSNKIENISEMMSHAPRINDYWLDKAAKIENIDENLPVYAVGSWTNALHTLGTFQAWERLRTSNKWLRTHTTHEWHDYYTPTHVADLHKFFEKYLNNVDNDWETTPRVRLSLLNPGHDNIIDQPETKFPLSRQKIHRYYLDASTTSMSPSAPSTVSSATYNSTDNGTISFRMKFEHATDFVGYATVRLWVQAPDHNDMDLFCYLQKSNATTSKVIPILVLGSDTYVGAQGRVRVSLRDHRKPGTNGIYQYVNDEPSFLNENEIVPVDIPFWPTAIHYEAGEELTLLIQGWNSQKQPEFQNLGQPSIKNVGRHTFYTGDGYKSYVEIPQVIPAK